MPLGTEVGLSPGDIALVGDPAPHTERGTAAPIFRAISIVDKRSPISQQVLSSCLWRSLCLVTPFIERSEPTVATRIEFGDIQTVRLNRISTNLGPHIPKILQLFSERFSALLSIATSITRHR